MWTRFTQVLFTLLPVLAVLPAELQAMPSTVILADQLRQSGDAFYTRREYSRAHPYFQELYRIQPDPGSGSRLLLSSLRLDDDRLLEHLLSDRPIRAADFTYSYLGLYTAYRLQRPHLANSLESMIDGLQPSFTQDQRQKLLFLLGARLIDERRLGEASLYYQELSQGQDPVAAEAGMLLADLHQHSTLSQKSPWIAVSLSAVMPGAGQFYSRHWSDGTMAFFWNLTFLGGSAYLYDLERSSGRPHTGSVIAGMIGLIFYAANLTGAYTSAHRYNGFHERRFAEQLRQKYFSIDRIERSSGIEFTRPLQ